MTLLQEYPKAVTVVILGLLLYFLKPLIPDFFTPEITTAIELVISAVVVYLIGYLTRIKKSEAEQLKSNSYNQL